MKYISLLLKMACISVSSLFLFSCGAGLEYDHTTGTLTVIPAEVFSFKDLSPDKTANQLYSEAQAYETEGKTTQAFKTYKKIAKDYSYTTKAPESYYRMAQHYESKSNERKAFDHYQVLIENYMGSPLFKPSLDRQTEIAQQVAQGIAKHNKFFLKANYASDVAEEMIQKLIKNAPHVSSAPQSAYILAQMWDRRKEESEAIEAYRYVTRNYPESGYSGDSLYRIGEILYQQSLKGNTNLDNAKYALETFNELKTLYPNHPKTTKAKELSAKINGYSINRSMEVAKFYEKKKQYISAIFYYKDVLAISPKGSEFYAKAAERLKILESTSR